MVHVALVQAREVRSADKAEGQLFHFVGYGRGAHLRLIARAAKMCDGQAITVWGVHRDHLGLVAGFQPLEQRSSARSELVGDRSEERRVGKECRSRGSAY